MNNHTPPAEPTATNRSWVLKIPRIAFRTVLYLLALAYNAVTRSALYLVSGYLLTYFTLNADAGRAEVMDLLSSGLPGDFSAQSLQWGPFPHEVTLVDTVIKDSSGEPIITVSRASVLVDWRKTRQWLLRKIFVQGTGTEVLFSHATVQNPRVRIAVDADGWTGIAHAFSDKTRPDDSENEPRTLVRLDHCRVENATVETYVSDVAVVGSEIDIPHASVLVHGGKVRVVGELVTSATGAVRIQGAGPKGVPLVIPWNQMQSHDVVWDSGELDIGRGRLGISESYISLAGHLDTRGITSVDMTATVQVARDEPLVVDWVENLGFEGTVTFEADGPVAWPHLDATIDATRLVVSGVDIAPLSVVGRMLTTPFRRVARLSPIRTNVFGGELAIEQAEYYPGGYGRDVGTMNVALNLEDVHPQTLYQWGFLRGPVPNELTGLLVGDFSSEARFRVDANGALGLAATGHIDLEYEWSEATGLLPAHSVVVGRLDADLMPSEKRISATALRLDSDAESIRIDGQYDMTNDAFDLDVVASADLGEFLQRLGVNEWRGRASLNNVWLTGSSLDPWLIGQLSLRRGRIAGVDVERLDAFTHLKDGTLQLQGARARTGLGTVETEAEIRLWNVNVLHLSDELPLSLSQTQVRGLSVSDLGVAGLSGTATIDSPQFELKLGAPGFAPDGRLSIQVSNLEVGNESFKTFGAKVTASGGKISLPKVTATSDGGAELSGKGSWDQKREVLDVDLAAEKVDLTRLAVLNGVPIRGVVSVTDFAVSGSLNRLGVSGRLTFKDFGYSGIQLGDATLSFKRPKGGSKVRVTSSKFFPSMELKRGELTLDRSGLPRTLVAQVAAHGTDLLSVLPALKDGLARANIDRGIVLVDVPITGNRDFRLIADLPDGALKVRLSESSPMVTNDGSLWASLIGDQVKIDRLVASARGQRLATCGKLNLSGRVALDVAGSLELGQITGLDKVVSDLEGRLITGVDGRAGGKDPFDGSCLMFSVQPDVRRELGNPQGFLRIQNNLSAPTFAGSVSFEGVRMIPRGFGREVTIDSGVMYLRKSKGLQGAVELEIPSDAPLRGTIDEGAFQLTGLAKLPPVATREQLQHWLPDTGYINFSGTDLYWAEPKEYRVVLDPKLRMRFANVWQPDEEEDMRLRSSNSEPRPDPSLSLSGTISVPEGSYFESFTLLARSIGSVLQRREVDGPSKSITKSFPLLQRLKFDDFKVSGQNLVVQSDFGVGKTDLDTRFNFDVRGTLEDPRLFGFLDVTDGTLTYSVFRRVFEVTRGRLDFDGPATRPKLDILAETSIEAPRAGAGRQDDEFEDYSVQVAVTGRIPDYKLTLSSKPTLPEIDVQYLILLGKTKQQLSDEGFGQSSLELVSADIGSLVSQWIEAPFLDEVRVQPTVGGGGRIEAILRLGRSIRIGLVGRQEGGVTSYDARFRQKIRDNLLLEAIRRGRGEDNRERQRYEVQLKYTIPVD